MAKKKRRCRIEPEGEVEQGNGFIVHKFGISSYHLGLVSKREPLVAVEWPLDTDVNCILLSCIHLLERFGITRPDPKVVVDVMRISWREFQPERELPPSDADDLALLRADPAAYVAAMIMNRMPKEAETNLAHPVRMAVNIIARIGLLQQCCDQGLDRSFLADMAAGIGVAFGQLEVAVEHGRDALIGERVRAGNRRDLAERARERRKLWEAKLGTAERKGSKLRHGEVERIAREIADALGSRPEAERRWYERNMRQRRSG
jgi:hypothetical protein